MDPRTVLKIIVMSALVGDPDATYEAMEAMHGWLSIGGARPDGTWLGCSIILSSSPTRSRWSYMLTKDVFSAFNTETQEMMRWDLAEPVAVG